MSIRKSLPLMGPLVLVPTIALAQNEAITVTAAPPDALGSAAFSAVHLDSEALSSTIQLDAALRQVPGLSLFRRDSSINANPTVQGVSLRSIAPSGAGRALVTLDGVPQNDPFGGWVIWSALPSEIIGSATVVRGAGSGPYGAGALTGVVSLNERHGDGLAAADLSAGDLGYKRAATAGGVEVGPVQIFASASGIKSDGWIPVAPTQAGAVDTPLSLEARNASIRVEGQPMDGTLVSARFSVYDEYRNSGVVGNTSSANGYAASITVAHPETEGALGWRLQAWLRETGFTNTSSSIAPDRASRNPANNQFATPAEGLGMNAALRGAIDSLKWEVGVDARSTSGESREQSSFLAGTGYRADRKSGGRTFVGGAYIETSSEIENWLITAGVRADYWSTTDGHLFQKSIQTGAVQINNHFPARSGTLPTGRVGARYNFSDDFYLRSAAYAGFRVPTLNELYRSFRVGNEVTASNENLTPEKLYGVEVGAGGKLGALTYDGTVFFNQLHGAITNVTKICVVSPVVPVPGCPSTVGPGTPAAFPVAGFLPAGGSVAQRTNAGNINAFGFEGEAQYPVSDSFRLKAALAFTDAHVDGGSVVPNLTDKRPSQTPRWTVTAGAQYTVIPKFTVSANLRYESDRYSDDINTELVPAATSVDVQARYEVMDNLSLYVASENVFNTRVASSNSSGLINYAAPRIIRAGISFAN